MAAKENSSKNLNPSNACLFIPAPGFRTARLAAVFPGRYICRFTAARNKSFTLLETLVSIVILAVILGAVYMIWNSGEVNLSSETGLIGLQQKARLAMEGITRELRKANNASIVNASAITFTIPGAVNPVSYYLNGNKLVRENPAGTTATITDDIDNLSFSLAAKTVEIGIGTKKNIKQRELRFNLKQKITLRN